MGAHHGATHHGHRGVACGAGICALRNRPADGPADKMLALLHDARKASIDYNATVTLRMDPKTLKYQVDTSGVRGSGRLAEGTLDMACRRHCRRIEPRLR